MAARASDGWRWANPREMEAGAAERAVPGPDVLEAIADASALSRAGKSGSRSTAMVMGRVGAGDGDGSNAEGED